MIAERYRPLLNYFKIINLLSCTIFSFDIYRLSDKKNRFIQWTSINLLTIFSHI